jgi:iron complex outermembrane receptor protein
MLSAAPIAYATVAVMSILALAPGAARAQSSATIQMEEIVVSARRSQESLGGLISAEEVAKSRSSVTTEYLESQIAGQSIIQSVNILPGVNFTNNDPYGASGGNMRLRSFDGNRISVTFDGVPLNDTGNYAIFTNQLLDPEIIERTTVNLGTTDVDSPTASATGGTINILSRKPKFDPAFMLVSSLGSYNFHRTFLSADTGAFGPWDTTAFLAVSYQRYDKFKGPGDLQRWQINGKVHQEFGESNFISVGFHYNRNRNDSYRTNLTKTDLSTAAGYELDNFATCGLRTPTPGGVDNENLGSASDPTTTASCTNLQATRINPSNTGNIRGQSSFALTDSLRLNVDPSFQYVLATGGTTTGVFAENTGRLVGNTTAAGVDLNGDGDFLDSIRVYDPSVTNTHRYGVTASLIWQVNEDHVVQGAYTLDYGRHRQTGDAARLQRDGTPIALFPGRDGRNLIQSADGVNLRFRDRFSIATLNQVAVSYTGKFFDDMLRLTGGLRAPFFHRELNQYCYTQSPNTAYCTTQTPTAPNATGFVSFPLPLPPGGNPATQYKPPFTGTKNYDKVLPSAGLSFRPFGEEHMFFISYAQGLSAPRTDNLYSLSILNVAPETTRAYDLGYRYQTPMFNTSAAVWMVDYKNRIVTSFDPDLNISVDRNVGSVDLWGVDLEAGATVIDGLTVYASGSYNHSKVKNNLQITATTVALTAGKKLVETPDWTIAGRVDYKIDAFGFGAQVKYVGKRFATDVNDEVAESYTLVDANVRYSFAALGLENAFAQVNVSNLFDKKYKGSISSRTTATPGSPGFSGAPTYAVGGRRAVQGSIHVEF